MFNRAFFQKLRTNCIYSNLNILPNFKNLRMFERAVNPIFEEQQKKSVKKKFIYMTLLHFLELIRLRKA